MNKQCADLRIKLRGRGQTVCSELSVCHSHSLAIRVRWISEFNAYQVESAQRTFERLTRTRGSFARTSVRNPSRSSSRVVPEPK